jgi:undecaprenyl-diphosphatase
MEQKGIAMITSDNMHLVAFIAGNFVAFIVAAMAIRFFITFLKRYGVRMWGWYRIVAGLVMLAFIYIKAG